MAKCTACLKEMGFADKVNAKSFDGLCRSCTDHGRKIAAGLEDKTIEEAAFETRERNANIDALILTTETGADLKIIKRIEIVTAECAFGMNVFKDMFTNIRDFVGGRSKAVQKTLRDSRRTALYELKKEAYEVGANAVVGVDLDYVELSLGGSMLMLVASGTAVVVEE